MLLGVTDQPTPSADISGLLYGTPTRIEMTIRFGATLELTDAFWDLVPLVAEAGRTMDRRTPVEVADASPAGRRLPEATRIRIREAADGLLEETDAAFRANSQSLSTAPTYTEAQILADPFGVVSSFVDFKGLGDQFIPKYAAIVTSFDEVAYFQAYAQATSQTQRTPMLLRALFITVMGTVEPLLTRLLMHLLLHAEPTKYVSLADPALDKAARKLAFGSPLEWRDILVSRYSLFQLGSAIDWDALDRLWQDRHVITHRGNAVDARHNAKTGTPIGTIIDLSPEDLQAAVDLIGAIRYALVTAIWDRIDPGMGAVIAENTSHPILANLRAARWQQAIGLTRVQEAYATDSDTAAEAKVNRWLAEEHQLGHEAIRRQVEAWDTTGLGPLYLMAREVLLRHDDAALRLLQPFLADGSLSDAELADWPLFDRLREEGKLPLPQAGTL